MPTAQWTVRNGRPVVEVLIAAQPLARDVNRVLIADTGAGSKGAVFQLILSENDCLQCGGVLMGHVQLGGAFSGAFPAYLVEVRMPQLNFIDFVPTVAVKQVPAGFDGIAGFEFLNRFHYGNFGNQDSFGFDLLPGP